MFRLRSACRSHDRDDAHGAPHYNSTTLAVARQMTVAITRLQLLGVPRSFKKMSSLYKAGYVRSACSSHDREDAGSHWKRALLS
jgi:hypothetical protein